MRMPISKGGGARFRGPTSSQEYNQNEDEKYQDILELYKQSNQILIDLKENHETVLLENQSLHQYVTLLENQVAALENKLNALNETYVANQRFFKTAFVQDMTTTYVNGTQEQQINDARCDIDLHYRHVTIPMSHKIPKTYIESQEGKHIVPSELKIRVGRSSTSGVVKDNDIRNAFNNDGFSFWRRTVTYDHLSQVPEEGEDVIIEIELPNRMVNNLNINTLHIDPHPERGVHIKDVEVHYRNGWNTIKGFEQNEMTTVNKDLSPKRKWYFPQIPIQKIRITLIQRHPITMAGKTVFTLGAKDIGVHLSIFDPSGGMVLTPIEMEGIYNIESVEHVFLNRKTFSYPENMDHMLEGNIFDYELYTEEQDGILRLLSNEDWQQQSAKKIWVKTHMYPDPHNGVPPCLHAIRLHCSKT